MAIMHIAIESFVPVSGIYNKQLEQNQTEIRFCILDEFLINPIKD